MGTTNPETAESTKHASRVTVLIVEDERPIAEAIALVVEEAGFTHLVAAHGREGLTLARAHRPALIITDMMMPQLDGAELIAALRADAERDHQSMPPVILMTAGGLDRARMAGADAVLRKPFDIAELEALLRRFLESGDSRR